MIKPSDEFGLVDCLRGEHGVSLQAVIPQARLDALEHRKRNLAGHGECGLCGVKYLQVLGGL